MLMMIRCTVTYMKIKHIRHVRSFTNLKTKYAVFLISRPKLGHSTLTSLTQIIIPDIRQSHQRLLAITFLNVFGSCMYIHFRNEKEFI